MSDNSAQPASKMVNRFVANPNSAIGSLLKKGIMGKAATNQGSVTDSPPVIQASPVTPTLPTVTPPASVSSITPQDSLTQLESLMDQSVAGRADLGSTTQDLLQDLTIPPVATLETNALDVLDEVIGQVEAKDVSETADPTVSNNTTPVQDQTLISEPVLSVEEPATQIGVLPQVVPQVIADNTDSLNPQHPVKSVGGKEAVGTTSLDQLAVDASRGAQQVELEPSPEIPPEVESYLQKVEDHANTAPKEIVIADGSNTQPNNHNYPSQPVVVLPITPEIEKQGAHKSPKFSVRWLVEWSRKVMKIFSGKVIYRLPEEGQT